MIDCVYKPSSKNTIFCRIAIFLSLLLPLGRISAQAFVGTSGPNFVLNGQSFYFSGANNYYLIYKSNFMVDNVLTNAVAMNLKVIRAWGFIDGATHDGKVTQPTLGVYDPSGFERIDYFVSRARQLGIKLIIPFVNNWDDFGGMDFYVTQTGGGSHEDFYTRTAIKTAYKNYIAYFLTRTNQYTGVRYTDEPTVFAWELANEPRSVDATCATLTNWAGEMSAYIKSLDTNHLVCVGDEGFYNQPTNSDWTMNGSSGVDWLVLLRLPKIDFGTVHLYPDNWSKTTDWATNWIAQHLRDGHALGKPVLLEEYGYQAKTARDAVYAQWTQLVENGGNGDTFWMLAGVQDDGSPYPDYDGFTVYNPSSTATVLANHAAVMLARSGLPPLPYLAITDAVVNQLTNGSTNLTFTVTLSPAVTNTVTVNFATSNLTATAGTDYLATNGVLVFLPATRTRSLAVKILGGSIVSGSKTFSIYLSAASNAVLSAAQATGTIIGPTPPATPAPPAGVTIGFHVDSDWGAGANVTFTLTNSTASAINNWTLAFDYASVISPYSGAVVLSQSGSHQVLTNLSYGVIPPNGTFSFQCSVTPGNLGSATPANYLFNGASVARGGTNSGSGPAALQITTASLPAAGVGEAYSQTLAASGGTNPYAWNLASGALPGGLTLASNSLISGTATNAGNFDFTVQVIDSSTPEATTNKAFSISVATLPALAINDVSLTLAPLTNGSGGSNTFFSTLGNQIVDAGGNPVRLTGINWFGFETSNKAFHGLWSRGYKAMLDQVKSLGFNTLRVPFSNEMLTSNAATSSIDFNQNPDLQGLTPLQVLDKVVAYCGQIGLRIYLDRHSAKADDYTNEDVWYIAGDAYNTEQRWIDDWVMLATHFAGNPTIIGADLFNEPKKTATWGNNTPATDWNKAAERCGNAILAANPNWLIIVEGTGQYAGTTTWWGGDLQGAATYPVTLNVSNKLVYSMHDYPSSVFVQTWFTNASYPTNLAGTWNGFWGYLYRSNTAPLLLGEFGTPLATVSDQQWLGSLVSYIDGDFNLDGSNDRAPGKKGISFTYWCLNPDSGDTGGILNNDWTTVNYAKMAYLTNSLEPMLGSGTGTNSQSAQTLTFTVTLSQPASGAISVQWTTVDGTAAAGTDYTAASGTLNFSTGQSSNTISITIPPHSAAQTRQFTVQLSSPSGATLAKAPGTGNIIAGAGSLSWMSIADATVSRGSSGTTNLNFTVTLSAVATNSVSANFSTADGTALAGTDYVAASGTVNFSAGVTQQVVSVTVNGAAALVPTANFFVTLSSATKAYLLRTTATGTITNLVVTPTLTVSDATVYAPASGTNFASFTLSLNTAVNNSVSVQVATENQTALAGTDYLPANQTVTFAAGQTQQIVSVPILPNTNTAPAKSFVLNLSNASGLTIAKTQGAGTIYFVNGSANGKPPTGLFNYAEALQKSLFFYECQRSGVLPAGNRVSWRGNAAVNDGSDVGRDLTGGWFDAGDHVKFGLPMAASATLLAWGGIEYPTAYAETGQQSYLLDNLKWVCDYFIKCDVLDTNGDTLEFYGQVGSGSADHAWWGAPEVMTMARPAYKVTRTAPGSDLTGETAAALAACSILFQSSNPTYASNLLAQAKKLYKFADTYRGKYSDSITDAQAFYNSWSGYMDELMWGGLWLYRATGDTNYLAKAQAAYSSIFVGNWGDQSYPALKWTHAWDDKTYGSLILLSELTTNAIYRINAERYLNWWTIGRPDSRITYTSGGLAWLDTWGSLRYANNTALMALIYSDRVNDYTNRYRNFAISQVNYTLGFNPGHRSFMCGFGTNPPVNPHHRGAHGSWDNNIYDPPLSRHTLYGAVPGGPDSSDGYADARDNYTDNEVACDYNAGLTGALARLYQLYGGYTLGNFPVPETPTNQFFVLASLNQTNTYFTEIRALLNNCSAWPARAVTNLHYRYFANLSELYAAGGSTNNVTVTVNMASGGTFSGLRTWDESNHVYYVEASYDGVTIVPGGSTSYNAEAQFRLTIPNSFPTGAWNPANDWSYQGLLYGNQKVTNFGYLVTYMNGVKLEGTEPPRAGSYATWQSTWFTANEITNAAISGDSANPSHNGYPNLLQYAMGLNPKSADTSLLPHLQVTNISGQPATTITYCKDTAVTDVALYLDESTNLVSWTPAVSQTLWTTNLGTRVTQQARLHPTENLKHQLYLRLRAQRIN